MFNFLFNKKDKAILAEPKKEKEKVGIRKLLADPNKPIDITLSTKEFISSIGTHEKRQIIQAILDIYKIKAELKEPRKRIIKKPKDLTNA